MTSYAPIYNPSVPFQSAILGGISDGKKVTVQGQLKNNAKTFAVNFICYNNDIAFHFNPRPNEGNVIVCNTQQYKSWGAEERTSLMPFQRNSFFDINITVLGHAFQVTVNGQYILEYRHRIPYQNIQNLQVTGDVALSCITFSESLGQTLPPPPAYSITPNYVHNVSSPPAYSYAAPMVKSTVVQQVHQASGKKTNSGPVSIHNPVMPFQAVMPGNPIRNRSIIITGNVAYGAVRFHVNLLNSRTRSIMLQINPRFNEGALVRNTQDRGTWGPEERHVPYMPFSQGQSFQMEIKNEGGFFSVFVNGAKIFTYVHRLPANQIDMIEVAGDVTLTYVQY
ncbi:galectin-9 isoform X2 [Bombina bombina]|uniref:galectin-9 isoform X2 n=1 Tax=Bombina bombina TaxID=8345 RepID=UPI00235A9916|nr:galectin-9 isoform X2 [Bombina bombina]